MTDRLLLSRLFSFRPLLSRVLLCGAVSIAGLTAAPLAAQADEAAFLESAAKRLNGFATRCFKAKYPLRAREIWLELLRDYDGDDAVARKALGFLRVGSTWAPDMRFEYPTADEPDPAVARVLNKSWESLAEELGRDHRELAEQLAEAGDEERAKYHFKRALRFVPDDEAAIAGSGQRQVEGLVGSEVELALLQRSLEIDRGVLRLFEEPFDVEPIPADERNRLLDLAGVEYHGVRSEHFAIWGDWDVATLAEGARFAERAYAVAEIVFDGEPDFKWPYQKGARHHLAYFQTREDWTSVLNANASSFKPGELAFVLANTSGALIRDGDQRLRACAFDHAGLVNDMSVRDVAQTFAGLRADALNEGVGHAFVGWMFGRNLIFAVAQAQADGRTSTGKDRARRFESPDLSVWTDLAIESAWEGSDTPAAELPLITAARFTSEQRIKSWSFCDYLLRRDPRLLRILDRTSSKSNPNQVAEAFAEKAGGLTLVQLDEAWRRFWTDDTPILRAIRGKETPLEAVSKAAPQFLEGFNELRTSLRVDPVTWSAGASVECRQHAEYLLTNRKARGPTEEHRQDPKLDGATLGGSNFAAQAVVSTSAKDPKKTFADWLDWPGYRDAILDTTLESVGIYVDRGVLVMDVSRGRGGGRVTIGRYPFGVAPGTAASSNAGVGLVVPTEVEVAELGADVSDALRAQGDGKRLPKTIGYPISLHFRKTGALPPARSIRCTLKLDDRDEVPGFVQVADQGASRRTSAPGLVVFYPLQPLKRGSVYTVEWSFESRDGIALPKSQFFTK